MRILYTLCGVGRGHAARSEGIIRELEKEHEIMIASYDDAYDFLKNEFKEIKKLKWFKIEFQEGKIKTFKTLIKNVKNFPEMVSTNFKELISIVKDFNPDLIVSDYEFNSLMIGSMLGIPVITISNVHMLQYYKTKRSFEEVLVNFYPDKGMLIFFQPTDALFITHFIEPNTKYDEEKVFFFGPVARKEVINQKTKKGDFYLAYFSDKNMNKKFVELFAENFPNEKIKVYGSDENGKHGNVEFYKFNSEEFKKNSASCKGIFCHGGYSLTAESLLLKKPICVWSPHEFYERYFNGYAVEKLGYGIGMDKLSLEKIKEFVDKNDEFYENLKKAKLKSNEKEIAEKIIELGNKWSNRKKRRVNFLRRKKNGFFK